MMPHQRPRVLFVATTPFAVNAFLASHLKALAERYEVHLCVDENAYELSPDLRRSIIVDHADFARKIDPVTDLRSLYQLVRIIARVRPQVIHSIMPKSGLLAMLAGFVMRVPHRWHTFTGQVWANKRGLKRFILQCFDRLIVATSTAVFADSPSQCRLLNEEGIVGRKGVNVLGDGSIAGVDANRFRPDDSARRRIRDETGTSEAAHVFLYVGRMARDKGILDLLKAFRLIHEQRWDVELWYVGPDEEGLWGSMSTEASRFDGAVRWLGKTIEPEAFIAAADTLVLASYREGFGSVIIEAAACGIPCIAYRIDGVTDAVEDGVSGVLVPIHDIEAFAQTMLALCGSRLLNGQLGAAARVRALQKFSATSVTKAWVSQYVSVLG